jgi:CDP-L-myo-inositol myo-inositolphosphotransferase
MAQPAGLAALSALLLLLFPGIRPPSRDDRHSPARRRHVRRPAVRRRRGLIAGGLLFMPLVFDGVDGEIARATFRSSPAGAALDTGVDMATNLAFMLGVTINLGLSEGREACWSAAGDSSSSPSD